MVACWRMLDGTFAAQLDELQRLRSHRLVGVELALAYDRSESSACARDEFAQHL